MERYKELEEMLCDEIDKIAERGELNGSSLESLDKLAHTLKSLKTVDAMDDYSEDGGYDHDGMSYARGRRGAKRDSMGRYSSERYYNEGRYPERRY